MRRGAGDLSSLRSSLSKLFASTDEWSAAVRTTVNANARHVCAFSVRVPPSRIYFDAATHDKITRNGQHARAVPLNAEMKHLATRVGRGWFALNRHESPCARGLACSPQEAHTQTHTHLTKLGVGCECTRAIAQNSHRSKSLTCFVRHTLLACTLWLPHPEALLLQAAEQ